MPLLFPQFRKISFFQFNSIKHFVCLLLLILLLTAFQEGSKFSWGSCSKKRILRTEHTKPKQPHLHCITSLLPSCNSEPWVLYSLSPGKTTSNKKSFKKFHLEVTVSAEPICWAAYSQSSLVSQHLCTQNCEHTCLICKVLWLQKLSSLWELKCGSRKLGLDPCFKNVLPCKVSELYQKCNTKRLTC